MYRHISAKERDLIAVWKGQDVSHKEIARRLHRQVSTIGREVRRNSFKSKYYVAISAQAKTRERRIRANRRYRLGNPQIEKYVLAKLGRGWSPEQIAGRLRLRYHRTIVSHEAIYQYVYQAENKKLALWEYLRRGRKKRRRQHGRSVHRGHIPLRVSIRTRSEETNAREEFGHWEGDTMEGKSHRNGLHVEAERLSRYLMADLVASISSEETIQVQLHQFATLPETVRKSTTLDNGRENHLHFQLRELGMDTYFCDPYSSWQKGTVENTIGLVRSYLPKGTDLASLSPEELADIVEEINTRPRKRLGYNTPKEVFTSYLKVAL